MTTSIISQAYMKLQNSMLEEEALLLYLAFSLCLPPRSLWFLNFDSVSENNILTIWNLSVGDNEEIILSYQTKRLLINHETRIKAKRRVQFLEERLSNDEVTKVSGRFIFSKKHTHWNNIFKSGFNRVCKGFDFTPIKIMNLSAKSMKMKNGRKASNILPVRQT